MLSAGLVLSNGNCQGVALLQCVPHPDLGGTHVTHGHRDPHTSHVDATSGVGGVQIRMF